ncbi:hypothetical protein GF324_13430 [bacterium]|nr:hypothetical protein [bacterium]
MASDGKPPLKESSVRWAFTSGELRILIILAVIILSGIVLLQLKRMWEYRSLGPVVVTQIDTTASKSALQGSSTNAPAETDSEQIPQKGGYLSGEAGNGKRNSLHSTASRRSPEKGTLNSLERLNINRATAKQLEELPGVGPVLAGRIVAHRNNYGPFRETRDLLLVRGIGPKTLARLDTLVTVLP